MTKIDYCLFHKARFLIIAVAVATLLCSCSVKRQVIVPDPVVTRQASYDGNLQNSGILSFGFDGFVVTQHWIDRYDALLSVYGSRLLPPVKSGDRIGIVKDKSSYLVTAQVMVRFTRMNQWRKNQAVHKPPPTPTPEPPPNFVKREPDRPKTVVEAVDLFWRGLAF